MDKKASFKGNMTLNIFTILESAGSLIWKMEEENPLIK